MHAIAGSSPRAPLPAPPRDSAASAQPLSFARFVAGPMSRIGLTLSGTARPAKAPSVLGLAGYAQTRATRSLWGGAVAIGFLGYRLTFASGSPSPQKNSMCQPRSRLSAHASLPPRSSVRVGIGLAAWIKKSHATAQAPDRGSGACQISRHFKDAVSSPNLYLKPAVTSTCSMLRSIVCPV